MPVDTHDVRTWSGNIRVIIIVSVSQADSPHYREGKLRNTAAERLMTIPHEYQVIVA